MTRIAVQIHPQHADYAKIRDTVLRVEEMGADVVYNWDHFYPLYGGEPDPNAGKHYECWTMLGAWAEQTERIEFGALVTCNSYRNANLLADMARTVDNISDGRLILGIGSGWFEKDFDEFGYDFGTAVGRLGNLEAALPVIKDRLGKGDPPPRRDIPILIGGAGEKITLRLVAEYADSWHTFGKPDTFAHKSKVLDEWCAKNGRDPSTVLRSIGVTPDAVHLGDEYVDLGADEITIGITGPDLDLAAVEKWIAWRDS
jgi:probable F420-dependent oxidoreductase